MRVAIGTGALSIGTGIGVIWVGIVNLRISVVSWAVGWVVGWTISLVASFTSSTLFTSPISYILVASSTSSIPIACQDWWRKVG